MSLSQGTISRQKRLAIISQGNAHNENTYHMQIFEIAKEYEKQVLFTVFLFGIIGIFWSFLSDFGIGESGYNFLGKTKKITLSPEEPVTQAFTAHENNLSQIHFVMNNANIKNDDYLEFQLMDGTCHDTITTKRFHSKPNKQGTYSIFEFAPIANSKDTRYCFSATYFSAENRKGEKPYLSATDVSDPLFSDRTLTDSNKNRVYPNQTLFLRPVYTSGSLIKDISELLQRVSQFKPLFLTETTILLIFCSLLVGTLLLAIRIVRINDKE